tara:strand:+ start:784 stop:1092 length:309 start_codon:yes stop_codon:yes gene_type:complete
MPIHKRDRNFQNIVSELDVKSIPTEYIQQLNLVCENGDRIAFREEDLEDFHDDDLVLGLINLVEGNNDLQSKVVDVEIIVDYKKLENEVKLKTEKILNNDNS